ncbi:3'-5' exoribonuclease YhaM [Maioricimonas rarisocia]|uniref:3'-5' exoribonuclease YhaM n=1 Tax=Maioricimonas rarisocia TaxID=2528026 RepID=A0A517Z673_9PLAN|nr:HD domain-containing protein [Maioricimonas rarisocia]QDU37977.1 3'-5' exoribonuclease YhaM [Maioricimonas rarisocia]
MQLIPDNEPSPRIVPLGEMQPGTQGDCFVLLVSKDRSTTRDGKPYFRVVFRDPQRSATAMIWSDGGLFADCEQAWQPGTFYKLRCRYTENQYGPQIDIDRIREVVESDADDGFEPDTYFQASRFDMDAMYAELTGIVQDHITVEPLQRLVLNILTHYAEGIKTFPAASRNHHAFRGGYLEHVLSVTKTALYLADKYGDYYRNMRPPLNKSLVIAGAVLHDIGKLQELDAQPQGARYTASGKLIGHILLGRDLVREHARNIEGLDPELLLRLEHIIVSHQNLPEWGSPVAPHTPEALLVYFSDDIDAKFYMVATALETDIVDDEEFTGRDNALRRSIFRGLLGGGDEQ